MSPRSTTLPLYFWNWGSSSDFLRWQRSINDAKWTFLPSFLASAITSFLFWLSSAAMPVFSQNFTFFLHCCLCIWYFRGFRHGNKLVHKIVVTQWIYAFSGDLAFIVLALRPLHAYPHRFADLNNTSIFCLVLSNCATSFLVLITLKSARNCCWHRNFKHSMSIFHYTLEFFSIRFNEDNTT